MLDTLYSTNEDLEVSFSFFNSNLITFKSEVKNITFNLSIVKFAKASDLIEKVVERESFSLNSLDGRVGLTTTIVPPLSDLERVELHLTLFDDYLNSRYFYFDLSENWTGGGKFFVRNLNLN